MVIEEIFAKLASHIVKGLMIHEQLSNYYDFLNLKGYKRIHEYNYLKETCSFRKLNRYYINHFNKLIRQDHIDNPNTIPESWFKYTRFEVDSSTMKNAIRNGFEVWKKWEEETKDLYESMYRELMNLGEVSAALEIKNYIKDVDCELKKVTRKLLSLKAIDFDMSIIVEEQQEIHDEYKELTKEIGKHLC